ncbi:DinB family protein [Deinococcus rubellus]|uniref:DinB family protein n=1 Tax=Deinococcus rubellus TaxID=1889240 RepID=A0ABY5YGM8_9DEIO|nr:DinB family protein [Deinococcus rubellus]UWX64076.1 DinB family protein [Deinococcus rubellus]
MTELTLLHESFRRNGRVNDFLLDAITEADLALSDGRGGWTVGHHLTHMAGFRQGWLSNISPEHAEGLPTMTRGTELRDTQELAAAFKAGDEAALKAVHAALDEGRSFPDPWEEGTYQSSPAHFLQHTIVHDSHHRGQIMGLLRAGGHTAEEMNALDNHWAIWRK